MAMTSAYAKVEPTKAQVDTLQGPAVLEFGAPWCGHCTAAQRLLESAFAAYPRTSHIKIEDGRGRPLGRSFRVKLWPTLVFLKNGKEITRLVRPLDAGVITKALAQITAPD